MLSALKRLRLLPPLAIWLSVCVPAPAQTLRAAARPETGAAHTSAAAHATSRQAFEHAPRPAAFSSSGIVRAADLNADGELDLVTAENGGLRTWINVRGRFVEHSPTRALLRHHTAPGFTTSRRASHIEDAVVSAERLALISHAAPVPFLEARSQIRPVGSPSLAARPLDAG